jgi:hypothetical protein
MSTMRTKRWIIWFLVEHGKKDLFIYLLFIDIIYAFFLILLSCSKLCVFANSKSKKKTREKVIDASK